MYLPTFDDSFLQAVVDSFRKRRKAIKHYARDIICNKIEERDGSKVLQERLELKIRDGACTIRMHAWSDRYIWLDCRKPAKSGWDWSWTHEGRLLGDDARQLVEKLERTIKLSWIMTPDCVSDFGEIWTGSLATGPKLRT